MALIKDKGRMHDQISPKKQLRGHGISSSINTDNLTRSEHLCWEEPGSKRVRFLGLHGLRDDDSNRPWSTRGVKDSISALSMTAIQF